MSRGLIDACLILFAVVAIGGAMSVGGPALDEYDALKDAQEAAAKRERFERGAQASCGENAAWRETADGSVVCFTKRGHKTMTAKVVL